MKHSRREFLVQVLGTSAAGVLGPGNQNQAAPAGPGPDDPSLVIDTHTHFYDPTRAQGVPWPTKDDWLLYRTVLPRDFTALSKPRPVAGTVVVEASPWLEDNQWVLDLAAKERLIVGFVGNLPVESDSFARHLTRFAANPLFRGIRINGGLLERNFDGVVAAAKRLAGEGLSLDLLGGPGMLPEVARLAKAVPDLRMIIDHVAGARVDGGAVDAAWRSGMRAAAARPNVWCKVSGLVEGTGRTDGTAPRDVEYYRPVLDVVWEAFGVDRLVFGSNWPVSERFATFATVHQIVEDYFRGKPAGALRKVFAENARAVYRWADRPA